MLVHSLLQNMDNFTEQELDVCFYNLANQFGNLNQTAKSQKIDQYLSDLNKIKSAQHQI